MPLLSINEWCLLLLLFLARVSAANTELTFPRPSQELTPAHHRKKNIHNTKLAIRMGYVTRRYDVDNRLTG